MRKLIVVVAVLGMVPVANAGVVSDTGAVYDVKTVTEGGGVILTTGVRSMEIPVDISGAESWDPVGSANNQVMLIDIGTLSGYGNDAVMDGIGWDVNLATVGGSWLSEATMYFDDNFAPDGVGVHLRAGDGDNFPGTGSYSSPVVYLSDVGIADIPLPDGWLRLEFYEGNDDAAGEKDADWLADSTVTISVVPEPASLGLLALGGLVLIRRR